MRITLMHNPHSGDEGHDRARLVAALTDAGHHVTYIDATEAPGDRGCSGDAELVVAAGGDGTVRDVFRRLAGSGTPVAILPLGTANNIARSVGLDPGADLAVRARAWAGAPRRRYDIGELHANGSRTRFVESVGGGLFAGLIARSQSPQGRGPKDDKLRRGLYALLDVALELPLATWSLRAVGHRIDQDLLGVEVVNVGMTGPAVLLAPDADPGDRQLDVVVVRAEDRTALVDYAKQRLAGETTMLPPLQRLRANQIVMKQAGDGRIRLDDELLEADTPSATVTVGTLAVDLLTV